MGINEEIIKKIEIEFQAHNIVRSFLNYYASNYDTDYVPSFEEVNEWLNKVAFYEVKDFVRNFTEDFTDEDIDAILNDIIETRLYENVSFIDTCERGE